MIAAGPVVAYPDRRLPDLVADHARRDPGAVAVRQGDRIVTYGQLQDSVTRLAAALRERGVGPEVLVGVRADREPSMIVGLLGVLAAGGGYVPLDPSLPSDRLRAIAFEASLGTTVGADLPIEGWPSAEQVECPAARDNVAYVMFTSGSTGRPKGVVIEHDGLTEFVTSLAAMAGLDRDTRCLALASIGFDASVIDILAPLAAGGSVMLAGSADRADPVRLQRFCRDHEITAAFIPPALLPVLDPSELPTLRVVMTGSEAPGPEQVARWATPQRRFLNLFGPTETTVLVTWFEASGRWDRPLPIGRVAANHRAYLVDADNQPVAPGQPGELLAGGPGLARGYLGDPELTAARFAEDPFVPGGRVYRTGDLVSQQPDGTLVFLGRTDRQVKVRGQRVEMGEVEATLRGHAAIGHAAVAFHDGQLLAFVTGTATPQEIRDHCARLLPSAMIPTRVQVLAELPLLSTGKVDLDRLIADAAPRGASGGVPAMPGPLGGPHAATDGGGLAMPGPLGVAAALGGPEPRGGAPVTVQERVVAEVWGEVLGEAGFGRDDDFFDRGGHSITAMRLVAELRPRLGREVSIEDVLLGRTLRGIAERAGQAAVIDGEARALHRSPALSPAQQRLWFLDRYSPEAATAYNVAIAERLTGELDVAALEAAFTAVIERQEILRWRISDSSGQPVALQDPVTPVMLPIIEADGDRAATMLAQWAREPFDLSRDRLWRARLIRLGPQEHILSLTLHHAVFDGWSQSLLYNDLAAAYAEAAKGRPAQLPALAATYADYAHYRVERQRGRLDADVDRWLSHLDGVPAVVDLPTDRSRPRELTFAAAQAALVLDQEATARVHELARGQGATPPAVLLAAFGLVLGRLTGQDEVVIGTPMVDRRLAEFQEMVGFFIEIAPLRLRVDGQTAFADQVKAARDELLAALAHPEAPLERLVSQLGLSGQVQRTPLVQVLFNMFNFTAPELKLTGLRTEPVSVPAPGSPFELTLYGIERDGKLRLEVVYNADLFGQARMTGLLESIARVLATGEAPARQAAAAQVPRARRKQVVPSASVPPATPTEKVVAGIWCDVLGRTEVGVTDSFFDVGGGSLAMAAVQQRLRGFSGRDLRLVDMFSHPTVRALARHLDGGDSDGVDELLQRAARRGAARRDRGRSPSGTERH
jgi:amino acid adenylation domain-containing protein